MRTHVATLQDARLHTSVHTLTSQPRGAGLGSPLLFAGVAEAASRPPTRHQLPSPGYTAALPCPLEARLRRVPTCAQGSVPCASADPTGLCRCLGQRMLGAVGKEGRRAAQCVPNREPLSPDHQDTGAFAPAAGLDLACPWHGALGFPPQDAPDSAPLNFPQASLWH